jgi:hypothetical protein
MGLGVVPFSPLANGQIYGTKHGVRGRSKESCL